MPSKAILRKKWGCDPTAAWKRLGVLLPRLLRTFGPIKSLVIYVDDIPVYEDYPEFRTGPLLRTSESFERLSNLPEKIAPLHSNSHLLRRRANATSRGKNTKGS